jgi:hypothetical protein
MKKHSMSKKMPKMMGVPPMPEMGGRAEVNRVMAEVRKRQIKSKKPKKMAMIVE